MQIAWVLFTVTIKEEKKRRRGIVWQSKSESPPRTAKHTGTRVRSGRLPEMAGFNSSALSQGHGGLRLR